MKGFNSFLLSIPLLFLSCQEKVTPCDCAKALFDFQIALSDSGHDYNKQEKIYEEYMGVAEQCEKLSEEMGKKEYLEAIVDCEQ